MIRTILVLALFICTWQNAHSQTSPCLRRSTDAANCATTPTSDAQAIQAVNFVHLNKRAGLSDSRDARYKAFWIFGDGNFFLDTNPNSTKIEDEANLDKNYIYHKSGSYQARAVLVEKKSNRQPPDKELINVDVDLSESKSGVSSPVLPGTNFTPQILNNNRAALLNHEKVRLGGYETALVVSSYLPTSTAQPVALVLYNSYKGQRDAPYAKGIIFTPNDVEVQTANYTSPDFSYIKGTAENTDFSLKRAMDARGYNNFIMQPVQVNKDVIPASFTEFRCFPILKTKSRDSNGLLQTGIDNLDTTGMGEAQFLTLILENANINPDYNPQDPASQIFLPVTQQTQFISSLSNDERTRILDTLAVYAPELRASIDTNTLRLPNGMYVRGIAHRAVQIVSSIDPTMLEILSICANGDNKYDVKMKMTICNEGNSEEDSIGVKIENIAGLQILNPTFDNTDLSAFLYNPTSSPTWSFAYTKGLKGAYNELFEYAPSCIERNFSFQTDWAGAQKLATRGALKATVHFRSALIKPTQEFPSIMNDSTLLTQQNGYNCKPDDDQNCWWLYVILFALGLVAWWWWKMKKEDEGGN